MRMMSTGLSVSRNSFLEFEQFPIFLTWDDRRPKDHAFGDPKAVLRLLKEPTGLYLIGFYINLFSFGHLHQFTRPNTHLLGYSLKFETITKKTCRSRLHTLVAVAF